MIYAKKLRRINEDDHATLQKCVSVSPLSYSEYKFQPNNQKAYNRSIRTFFSTTRTQRI
jgi:hypothetical protein